MADKVRVGSRMKVGARIMFAVVGVLSVTLIMGSCWLYTIARLGGSLDTAVNVTARKMALVGDMRTGFQGMRAEATKTEVSLINSVIKNLATNKGDECSSCHTQDTIAAQKAKFDNRGAALTRDVADLTQLADGKERQLLDGIAAGVHEWPVLYAEYMHFALDGHFPEAHSVMLDRIYPLVERLDKSAEELQARQQADLAAASVAAKSGISNNRITAFALIVASILIGGLVVGLVRGVTRSLHRVVAEMTDVSSRVRGSAHEVAVSSQSWPNRRRSRPHPFAKLFLPARICRRSSAKMPDRRGMRRR